MTSLLAIDGSLNACGLALFAHGRLAWVGVVKWKASKKIDQASRAASIAFKAAEMLTPNRVDRIVYEWPQVYAGSEKDPNDLFGVVAVSGDLVGRLAPDEVSCVLPRVWTAGIPKKVDGKLPKNPHASPRAKRIASRLVVGPELEVFREATTHDEIDAVGIGLYALGRGIHLRRRVYPGAV